MLRTPTLPAFLVAIFVLISGCTKPKATVEQSEAGAAPRMAVLPKPKTAAEVIDRWIRANNELNASLLTDLYANSVTFYTSKRSGSEVIDVKRSSFVAPHHPDAAPKFGKPEIEMSPDKRETWARFSNAPEARPIGKHFPGTLIIVSGTEIIEENEDLDSNWCLEGEMEEPTEQAGGFALSASEAMQIVRKHKRFIALEKTTPGVATDKVTCARRCADKTNRDCFYKVRLAKLGGTSTSNLMGWVEIDPQTKTVWWNTEAERSGAER